MNLFSVFVVERLSPLSLLSVVSFLAPDRFHCLPAGTATFVDVLSSFGRRAQHSRIFKSTLANPCCDREFGCAGPPRAIRRVRAHAWHTRSSHVAHTHTRARGVNVFRALCTHAFAADHMTCRQLTRVGEFRLVFKIRSIYARHRRKVELCA